MRSLNNFRAEQPHQHAMYYLRLLMTEVAWTKDELREALDGETLLIALFLLLFLSQSHISNSKLISVQSQVYTCGSFTDDAFKGWIAPSFEALVVHVL